MSTTPRTEPEVNENDARIRFLVRLARGLHMHGTPSNRIEDALEYATKRLGMPSQFFALPTVILAAFGRPDERSTSLIRVEPGSVHLEKLAQLDEVMRDLLRGKTTPTEGLARIDAIDHAPPRYGRLITLLAYGLVSGCVARFFGGGVSDILMSALLGLIPGLLDLWWSAHVGAARVQNLISSFLVSFLALAFEQRLGRFSTYVVTVSALIVLLPGLTLTMAMSELAAKSLVSGTVNLVRASAIFLELGFGVALGRALANRLFEFQDAPPRPLPFWTEWLALLIAPLCYVVLFRARPRDMLPVVVTALLGFVAARVGTRVIGPDLAGFAGAFVVGIASNLWARKSQRPVAIALLPGLLLLVPGSVGFRGLYSLLDAEVVSGLEAAFRMVMIAVSIVAGGLFANVAMPARHPF